MEEKNRIQTTIPLDVEVECPEGTVEVTVSQKFDARAYLNGQKALQDMKRQNRWLRAMSARNAAPPPVIPGDQ